MLGIINKEVSSLLKVIADNGSLIVYNASYSPVSSTSPITIPVSSAIFHNIKVRGFDLFTWLRNDSASVKAAVAELAKLKVPSIKGTTLPVTEYKKALETVASKKAVTTPVILKM